MKPEYPVLFAKVSTFIAIPIIFITTVFYVLEAFVMTAKDLYPFAIASFGITVTLSGVCFTMAPTKNDEHCIRYAGEKFLHSSLLLMQSIIIIYAKEAFLSLLWINTHSMIKTTLSILFEIVFTFMFLMAAVTWFWGFNELNKDLWGKWKIRIDNMRNQNQKKQ